AALAFVVERGLSGLYNAVPDAEVPPTNARAFGEICAQLGLPPLTFRGEIKTPTVPISSARLRGEGSAFGHWAPGRGSGATPWPGSGTCPGRRRCRSPPPSR